MTLRLNFCNCHFRLYEYPAFSRPANVGQPLLFISAVEGYFIGETFIRFKVRITPRGCVGNTFNSNKLLTT